MKMLIFYDSTGRIYLSMTVDEAPAGLEEWVFTVEADKAVERMDMTDPEHPVPVYIEDNGVSIDQVADDVTNLQIALAEVYEMIAGGME